MKQEQHSDKNNNATTKVANMPKWFDFYVLGMPLNTYTHVCVLNLKVTLKIKTWN